MLEVAADLAHEYDAAVHLVHAIPGQEAYYENTIDPGLRQFLMRSAREKISALQHEAGTSWELCVKMGAVADSVRGVAEEFGADLVVIGRGRIRSGLKRGARTPRRSSGRAPVRYSARRWPAGKLKSVSRKVAGAAKENRKDLRWKAISHHNRSTSRQTQIQKRISRGALARKIFRYAIEKAQATNHPNPSKGFLAVLAL